MKNKKGGAGRNQGRKPQYIEPTKTVAFRCPISHIEPLKEIVKEYLNQLKK